MNENPLVPVLQFSNVHVWYKDVHALQGIDLNLHRGEVHAVIGERRAGKSSLVGLLEGTVRQSEGRIILDGREEGRLSPRTSHRLGIGIVHQTPSLAPALAVIENVYLGRNFGMLFKPQLFPAMRARCRGVFSDLCVDIDLRRPAKKLSTKEKEMVELARAFLFDPRILVLDEIAPRLTSNEIETIFRMIGERKRKGTAVLYIANNLDEVMQIADRVTVLKDGRRRGTETVRGLNRFRVLTLTNNIVFNLNEDEKAENVLSLIELFNEALVNDLPLGIITLTPTFQISMMNWAAHRILDIRQKDMRGRDLADVLAATGVARAREIETQIRNRQRRSWNNLRTGGEKYINLKTFPLRDESWLHVGSILMFEDVSMDHFVKEYLLRAEKITSVAELAAGVAHEINNPLGIIKNYVVLLRAMDLGEGALDSLAKIEKELGRIVETIGSLLSYSRSQQNPVRSVELRTLIDETALLLGHRIRDKNISFRNTASGENVYVRADENKLKQLLINLITNSIEAVTAGGTIVVDLARDAERGEALITVTDDGSGIPPSLSADVFAPFFTTKMNKTNIGLGLSICKNIAESHGGTIAFESAPGVRTVFTVRLPIT